MSVLGIDFGGTKVALQAEVAGAGVARERIQIEVGEPATSVLGRTFALAGRLAEQFGAFRTVGVSTPGIVAEDRIDLAPNVDGWSRLDLVSLLREEFSASTVVIENDVKAAALAESREGELRGVQVGLYVNLGTGVAIASVIDGKVHHGAHGAAGEIGYGVVRRGVKDISLTLEEFAGGSGLSRRMALDSDVPAIDVVGLVAAVHSSASARQMWVEALDEIARHLLTSVLTLDPVRVVLGGGMVGAGDELLNPLKTQIANATPYPPEVVFSCFGADASLRGAVLLARDSG